MAGQVWVTDSVGGYMSAKNLSRKLRYEVQPLLKFRKFCDVKDASQQGKKKGDTFHWDVFSNVATAGTSLVETTTMPETQFTITQGTLTINEFGNSVPYSGKLDALSELPVTEIINNVLKFDLADAMDTEAEAQFDACLLRVVPTSATDTEALDLTEDGTATETNNIALGKLHVQTIIDTMKERNIPPHRAGDYYAVAWPSTLRDLKQDLEGVHQYTTEGYRKVMIGEIGRYEGCRFWEQTGIAKDAFTNAKSNWCYFFGNDTVAEGIAIPEEMRGKIPGDYGRSKGVAWYYLGGFGIVHTSAVNSRIIKWDSAA